MSDIVDNGTVDTIGFLAGALTTLSFLPQVIKVLRTRNTRSLSLLMYMLFSLGVFFWLVYGLLIRSPPIIFYNAVTFVLSVALLLAKIRWG
uniref:MtN3 and saliva related transmembrane protein n=1 Tax=Leptospirillum ferriphilum TaxID=178606 RepID=A0A7C3QTR5_9BACT